MAVTSAALHRFHGGALVPELDCPVPGRSRPPGPGPRPGPGPGPGPSCDVCALLAQVLPGLQRFVAFGVDGGGVNRSLALNTSDPQQLAWPNLKRVALGVTIPLGAMAWHGFTNRVSVNPGQNAGTPLLAGASWIYGTEWAGSVWIVTSTPPIDVRVLEISSS